MTTATATTSTTTNLLPPSTSPHLTLARATPTERTTVLHINSTAWKGPLSVPTYITREHHLQTQHLTRAGALTTWILVDVREQPESRTIYASCETFRKRALVAYRGGVTDVWTRGVGSVFCRGEFRGYGYARRMMEELVRVLDEKGKEEGEMFSVLYSDIGKAFYARFGWMPFASDHVDLKPVRDEGASVDVDVGVDVSGVRELSTVDVHACMCNEDVFQRERESLRAASESSPSAKVAIKPDFDHFAWHWAREEFYAQRLCPEKGKPSIKGAGHDSAGVYAAWNRNFGETPDENTLFVLRWTYEEPGSEEQRQATIDAMAAILRHAQREAYAWGMARVEFWNPSPLALKAVSLVDATAEVEHRETNSIASLRWTGVEQGLGDDVEWLWNEKYAWC